MPPVILDEFHGLGRVVDAPLCNGSIERIPFLLRYGGLLVPIAPDDDGFRAGSRKYGSFVIGEKPLELLLRAERDALAPVKIAVSALRILVKADLAPFLGGEITIERIAFPGIPTAEPRRRTGRLRCRRRRNGPKHRNLPAQHRKASALAASRL